MAGSSHLPVSGWEKLRLLGRVVRKQGGHRARAGAGEGAE